MITPAEQLATTVKRRSTKRPVVFVCRLKAEREKVGLKQANIVRKLDLGSSTLSDAENGYNIELLTALKLAAFFGKPVEELWRVK